MRKTPTIYYRSLSGENAVFSDKNFSGYEVQLTPYNKIWKITGFDNSVNVLTIKFWTAVNKVNIISTEDGLFKWFDVSGRLTDACYVPNGYRNGESIQLYKKNGEPKYTSSYFSNGENITDELYKMTEGRTVLTEEDRFNIYVKYGSFFKFYPEYDKEMQIDEIIKKCSST